MTGYPGWSWTSSDSDSEEDSSSSGLKFLHPLANSDFNSSPRDISLGVLRSSSASDMCVQAEASSLAQLLASVSANWSTLNREKSVLAAAMGSAEGSSAVPLSPLMLRGELGIFP